MVTGTSLYAVGIVVICFWARYSFDFVVLLDAILTTTAASRGLDVHDCGGPTAVDVRVEVLFFVLVEVGARVCGFVFEHLHEAVEAGGEEGAEDGSDPVDLGVRFVG